MPLPTFNKLGPHPTFDDLVNKINQLTGELTNLILNLDSLNVVSLTADNIDTGTLNANVVSIRSDLTTGYIQIDKNGMVVNNGVYDTFAVDINGNVSMTSARIRSAEGYPYVEMNYSSNIFGAYLTENEYIKISPDQDLGIPMLSFWEDGAYTGRLYGDNQNLYINGQFDLNIDAGSDLILSANGTRGVVVESFANLFGDDEGISAEGYFAKHNESTGESGSHNHGIADGTQLMTASGGSVTFRAAPTHTHEQT